MGRIKTKLIKRVTQKMMELHSESFGEDFAKNKVAIKSFLDIKSHKIENIVTGYVTKLAKLRISEK